MGKAVLQLKFKNSQRSRRKLVPSVAAFFKRSFESFGQSYRHLHYFVVFDEERQFAQIDPLLPVV